ncbi:MAG TPA: SH3 domain-containing protein [Casimicrobiaceae bacterium]|nr:SH3 domain-containing protein [Casimicrobiaceae bacterium]
MAVQSKMSAPGCSRRALAVLAAFALSGSMYAVAQVPQAPKPATPDVKRGEPAAPPRSADGRYGIQVLAATVNVHADATPGSAVLAQLQQGARLEADQRRGNWYRIHLADGRSGWIDYAVGKTNPNFSVDANPGIARGIPRTEVGAQPPAAMDAQTEAARAPAPEALPDDRILLQRPMGRPLEAIIPAIDPSQVPPPSPLLTRETVPVPDRWRIVDQLGIVSQRAFDPYNPNTLKGDRPIFGEDWFFNLGVISDTLFEARKLPTPIGAQSSQDPQANDQFGRGRQSTFAQNLIVSLSLLKGSTTFKPPELEFRFVPVLNYNVSKVEEVRALRIDPRSGTRRTDNFVGIQEAFVDYEYNIASEYFDFDDIRVGIQPFISDFRGFLFQDQPVGIRFFGSRESNRWQYNLAWFRRIDKDTNSGLNDIGKALRKDDVFVANLFRQDFMVPGFTLQGTVIHNVNRETAEAFLDNNGFQVRPAIFGDARPHKYNVTYLGVSGDGHFGRWNTTASLYYAVGRDDRNPFSQQSADISAFYGVGEVSRDFDWFRVRGTALYATGDKNPYDGKETGFDAILENPQIAGADTSFWIRQAVPLIGGGGVALSGRNGVLASLRSSKDQGQSNFTNPGVALIGVGADFDVSPRWRVIGNLNQLWFANTTVLSVLRNQGNIDRNLGTDVSAAVQYRPLFTQNIVLNASAAVLLPGKGLKQLYEADSGKTPYSILFNVLLTF